MRNEKFIRKLILSLAVILVASALPLLITNNYPRTIMCQILYNAILVVGLNYITGLTGQMNLGSAGIFAMGAYTFGLLTSTDKLGLDPWIGLVAAALMGYLIGQGLGYPSLRLKGVYLSLTTIAFTEIIRQMAQNLTPLTGGAQGLPRIRRFSVPVLSFEGGFHISPHVIEGTLEFFYFLLVFAIIAVAVAHRIVNSKWGREFKAIRDNVDAVESCGLDIAKIKIRAFTLASIYGAVAGALYASFIGYIAPTAFTVDLSIQYVVMMMIGGIGSTVGNILGAALITTLPELLRFLGNYYQLAYCAIALFFAIVVPHGLLSIFRNLAAMIAGKGRSTGEGGDRDGDYVKAR